MANMRSILATNWTAVARVRLNRGRTIRTGKKKPSPCRSCRVAKGSRTVSVATMSHAAITMRESRRKTPRIARKREFVKISFPVVVDRKSAPIRDVGERWHAVSYRDLEEILAERSVVVDHATLKRWVVKFSTLIAANAQARKHTTANSWRMPSRDIALQCPAG